MSSPQQQPHAPRSEQLLALGCCLLLSLAALVWSWRQGAITHYGDAVAHLHIARRILDSHRPGLTQLGSVWLPLPHLLMLPFVQIYSWWNNGLAGAIPSLAAYLASCVGLYRLARRWLPASSAALALTIFALNPNLLYLQTTPMTEPLFLCETVWAALLLIEWRAALEREAREAARALPWLLLTLVAAVFTRYDGWIMSLFAWLAMAVTLYRRRSLFTRPFLLFSALLALAPVLWFVYNAHCFGDWLYFARGPYSAAAIEARTSTPGYPPHPGWHDPWVSFLFFLECAKLDAFARGASALLFLFALLGTLWACLARGRAYSCWALLLWFPAPFYAYSISYGSVPIFMPVWWPHSWYNTRYGMELLPALALGAGFAAHLGLALVHDFKPSWRGRAVLLAVALIALNTFAMLRQGPLTYVEGLRNQAARARYDREIPPALRALLAERPGGPVLMITSSFPELVSKSGIPLRQTINESDKEFYQAALAAPARQAALVLAFAGDPVDAAAQAHPEGLQLVQRFTDPGQAPAALYRSSLWRAP